jgi:hypothetical protein
MALDGSTFAFAARVVKNAMKMPVAALLAKSAGTHSPASNGMMIASAAIRSGVRGFKMLHESSSSVSS